MLQYGGSGEARSLVFWLIVAGNGQSGKPPRACLRPFRDVPEQLRDRAGARTYWTQGPDPGPATPHLLHIPALGCEIVEPAAHAPNSNQRCANRPDEAGLTIKESF